MRLDWRQRERKNVGLGCFSLLARSAEGRLKKTLSDMGGVVANLTGGDARWMDLKVSTETDGGKPIHYELGLKPQGVGYEIIGESLYSQEPGSPDLAYIESLHGSTGYLAPVEIASGKCKLVPPRRQPEPGETALSVDPGPFPEPLALYKQLVSIAHYHTLDVGQRSRSTLAAAVTASQASGR